MRRPILAFALVLAACAGAAAADSYLADAVRKPAYAAALKSLLAGAPRLPAWTQEVVRPRGNYVGTPATVATVEGTRYELYHACKAHDCGDNQLEVMFAPSGARAWGAVIVDGGPIAYLGSPSPARQAALKAALAP
jgi:hypothetical protein